MLDGVNHQVTVGCKVSSPPPGRGPGNPTPVNMG